MATIDQKEIVIDTELIAACGLYCAACGSYTKGKCPGCKDNVKASWCKIRQCIRENNFQSCADCNIIGLADCRKYNNFMSKAIGYILNSDRGACIERIREIGYDDFAIEMSASRTQTIKRKR